MKARSSAESSGDLQALCQPDNPPGSHILGQSTAIQELRNAVALIARRSTTVLLNGETGAGKEIAAREIHRLSRSAAGPFVPVDCAAFSTELMESQLFGHVKGAFTSAVSATLGFIRSAHGGTLFLDEIGELPFNVQAKLLRCIQERAVVPVGASDPIQVDVRIIAATHRDLAQMVRDGKFRQDLYYRLNVVRLTVPPLRERLDDIPLLARSFLEEFALTYIEPMKMLTSAAEQYLQRLPWTGNVRELRNAIERAVLFCPDRAIDVGHISSGIESEAAGTHASQPMDWLPERLEVIPRLADMERMLIARVLPLTGGNQTQAAKVLDIERHRLRRKILQYGLEHLTRTGR